MRTFRKISDHKVNLALVAAIAAAYEHVHFMDDIDVVITFDNNRIGARVREIRAALDSGYFAPSMVGIRHNKMEGHFSERALWNIAHTFGDIIEKISVKTDRYISKRGRGWPFYEQDEWTSVFTTFFDRSILRAAKAKYLRRCAWGLAHK